MDEVDAEAASRASDSKPGEAGTSGRSSSSSYGGGGSDDSSRRRSRAGCRYPDGGELMNAVLGGRPILAMAFDNMEVRSPCCTCVGGCGGMGGVMVRGW